MNETMIKNFISFKMNTADKIIDRLPPEMSQEIKNLRRVIMDSIIEKIHESELKPQTKNESSKSVNHVIIE